MNVRPFVDYPYASSHLDEHFVHNEVVVSDFAESTERKSILHSPREFKSMFNGIYCVIKIVCFNRKLASNSECVPVFFEW